MKKVFVLVAMAAMLLACGEKPDNGGKPNGGGVNVDPDFESAIVADGDFSDWEALESDNLKVAVLPEGNVNYTQFKTFKVFADEVFIHIFCEFDATNTLVFVPYFDLDCDASTGTTSKWSGSGYDAKAEGDIWNWELDANEVPIKQLEPKAWDPAFYLYDETGSIISTPICESGIGAVMSSVPAPYKGGPNYAFEASIVRDALVGGYTMGESIAIGMYQYDMDWICVGQLPCITLEEMDMGELEYMLTVALP